MTQKATVVIGAMYGDEGKGLMTDYFVGQTRDPDDVCVVRFNGGAQAGHTVCRAGKRHVFGHFGSGALYGARTYLTEHFAFDPHSFLREFNELSALDCEARYWLAADPRANVVCRADVILNQRAERARGSGRHGSCGYGVGESVERNNNPEFAIHVSELSDPNVDLERRLRAIREEWFPQRAAQLGVSGNREGFAEEDEMWLSDARCAMRVVDLASPDILRRFPSLVFEGAQGLGLCQSLHHPTENPYVTRSYTGIRNALEILELVRPDQTEIVYVTRAYTTRHGQGSLLGEGLRVFGDTTDTTNNDNPWQGAPRAAPLDVATLARNVCRDAALLDDSELCTSVSLAVTHLDRMEPVFSAIDGDPSSPILCTEERFLRYLGEQTSTDRFYVSRGPSAANVAVWTPAVPEFA